MSFLKLLFDPQGSLRFYLKLYKISYKRKSFHLIIRKILIKKYDIHFGYNTIFEKDLSFPHPSSIVIGEKVVIEEKCTIYQGVTIGKDSKNKYPKIGKNVVIYPNSTLIGDISIGDNSIIGANSFVNFSIERNTIYAGNPAKKIGENK